MRSRSLVDVELAPLLNVFPTTVLSEQTLVGARQRVLPLPEMQATGVDVSRVAVPGLSGAPDVGLCIYRPTSKADALPCILHMHGGGFVMGSASSLESVHRVLASELNCVLISVEYRLAPETRFPGALEDGYAALAWITAESERLGANPERVGVMGESAGGGLAAALALLARDRGEHRLAFQHLIYPMLDDRTCITTEPHPFAGQFIWGPQNNAFGWSSLLGHSPGGASVSPYAAPARADDLSGLPQTFISTGALDLFAEEDLEYGRRLMRAGVPVEMHVYPGAFHAFTLSPSAQVAINARRDSLAALRRFLWPKP